jgi:hypothetical protein
MTNEIEALIRVFAPEVKIGVVKTTTEENLKAQFAHLIEKNCRFRIIVVIGHSNSFGLSLTSDRHVTWTGFTRWVELFEPKQMVLVACQSGQESSARDLFAGIPTLREVYAPPVKTTKPQSQIIKGLVLYLLKIRSADSEIIRLGHIFNFLLTGGINFRWLRREFQFQKISSA